MLCWNNFQSYYSNFLSLSFYWSSSLYSAKQKSRLWQCSISISIVLSKMTKAQTILQDFVSFCLKTNLSMGVFTPTHTWIQDAPTHKQRQYRAFCHCHNTVPSLHPKAVWLMLSTFLTLHYRHARAMPNCMCVFCLKTVSLCSATASCVFKG